MEKINSKVYWDSRFIENWESYSGPDQSRFFARLAIQHLPDWLITLMRRETLTLADWGCAQGDGTDEWATHLDARQLTGIDFSSVAIQQATQRYPAIRFMAENWLTEDDASHDSHDIVFSSNVIEHFHEPYDVLKALCGKALKAVVLALPYREMSRHEEHFFTFLPNNIPVLLSGNFRLVWSQIVDCTKIPNTRWMGEQIILVYANTQWMDGLGLVLGDCLVGQEDNVTNNVQLNIAVRDREAQIAALNLIKAQQENEWQAKFLAIQNELRQAEQMWADKNERLASSYAIERAELQVGFDELKVAYSVVEKKGYEQIHAHLEEQHALIQENTQREREWQAKFLAIHNELCQVEQMWADKNERLASGYAIERAELQIRLDGLQHSLLVTEREKSDQAKIYVEQQFIASQAHAERERSFNEQLVKASQVLRGWESAASSLQMEINTIVNSKFWQKTAILRKLIGWRPNLESDPVNVTSKAYQEKEPIMNIQFNDDGKTEMKNVEDLLSLYGEPFVRGAYQSLLGRHPDHQGLAYYLNRLKRGDHKLKILSQMSNSEEARKYNANIWGMDAAIRRYKLAQFPFMGWTKPSEERIENKLRMIEDGLHGMGASVSPARQDTKIEVINRSPAEVSNVEEALINSNSLDLTWGQFEAQVLLHRANYKGIFIQELVIDWNVPLYQRPQHIASAFGRLGYLVIYRTANWGSGDNLDGVRQVAPNVWMTSLWEPYNITGAIHSIYSTAYFHDPRDIKNRIKDGVIIYEYIDHIDPQISGEGDTIKQLLKLQEWAFGGGADFVVASAKKLEAESICAVGKEKVILAQNGVDTRHYRNPIHLSTRLPENLISFRKKYSNVVGYFGALAPWLWYEVIAGLVKARPDLGFVFIGPDYYGGSEKLPKAENVLYLGTVDYKILPAYARQFDVCFIPFAPGEIAHTTSPLKLFEYFALEKPVVVTSEMLECVAFKEVFFGESVLSLSSAIDKALAIKEDAEFKARLSQLADENDWEQRAKAMEVVFQQIFYKEVATNFGVTQEFVKLYVMQQGLASVPNDNWSNFRERLDPLKKMYVDFAMSTVERGRAIAKRLNSHSFMPNKYRYLDIGTAYGGFLRAFAEIGFQKVVGVELQQHLAEYAKANTVDLETANILNIDFEKDDISQLGKFDLITCNDVIEHVKNPALTIKKMISLLSEDGCAGLEIPNKNCIAFVKSDGHFQLFGIVQLDREDAATYYSEALGVSRDGYLFEMGESYELEWYQQKLTEYGGTMTLFDTHLICDISQVPSHISDFKITFENWRNSHKGNFSEKIFNAMQINIEKYISNLEKDFSVIRNDVSRTYFINKYLRSFWTVALKK